MSKAHRCWPSLAGWVTVGVLLGYVCYLHSLKFVDRETLRAEVERRVTITMLKKLEEERSHPIPERRKWTKPLGWAGH